MKTAIVIPARYGSTRLPGKPLLDRTGKPLIRHVYERAQSVINADRVVVATDDQRIFDCVKGFGGEVIMTRADHETGSGRVAAAAENLDADIIINLQGDEPEVEPDYIDRLINLHASSDAFASTLACRFPQGADHGPGSPDDPSAVKAILGADIGTNTYWARYFTRYLYPCPRDGRGNIKTPTDYFLHVGIYAFSKQSLKAFANAPAGALEKIERLEQLRILEMGQAIAIALVPNAAPGIDTPADYETFVKRWNEGVA
ncbi:3-deoxy-manno-octulosonate cytidylyltransferase [Hyphococcus formosus]|uniref:3-deoxy-manno-octulosonate cytidylyltransferase n=1 Tax=Hyphococcus formosus TaxID=3143534 RepID=UPI00398A645B